MTVHISLSPLVCSHYWWTFKSYRSIYSGHVPVFFARISILINSKNCGGSLFELLIEYEQYNLIRRRTKSENKPGFWDVGPDSSLSKK